VARPEKIREYVIEDGPFSGTYGSVLIGRHETLGWKRALKRLHGHVQGDVIKQEAQKLQAVKSPYVVQIHEFFTEEGIGQVLVMEYCPVGLDKHLRQRFAQTNGHLPYNEAREILESVLSGLNDAHSVDIVHGDIKPANCRSLGARPDHRRRLPLSRRHRTRLHRSVSRSLRMSKPRTKRRVIYFSFSICPTLPWTVLR